MEDLFYRKHGYWASGSAVAEEIADDLLEATKDLYESGAAFRLRVVDRFDEARRMAASANVEIIRPRTGQLLLGDVPAISVGAGGQALGIPGGVQFGDATTVFLPLSPTRLATLSSADRWSTMAQVNKQNITVGSGRIVSTVSVDGGLVRGEGGPIRPQLVVPLGIQMNPMPEEATLAVCSVTAWLSTDMTAMPHQMICPPTSRSLIPGLYAHSFPSGPTDHTVELRFFLSQVEVEDIEQRRHAVNDGLFQMYLGLEVVVAGVEIFNSFGPGQAPKPTPWPVQYGLFSRMLPFWTTQVSPVWVQIEQSRWVREVLPGFAGVEVWVSSPEPP